MFWSVRKVSATEGIGTYLDIFSKENSKEIKVISLKEPIKH